jgi:hypothetical protein
MGPVSISSQGGKMRKTWLSRAVFMLEVAAIVDFGLTTFEPRLSNAVTGNYAFSLTLPPTIPSSGKTFSVDAYEITPFIGCVSPSGGPRRTHSLSVGGQTISFSGTVGSMTTALSIDEIYY